MRILSRVCARFSHPQDRNREFNIRPIDRLVIMDAPDWIENCILFKWLVDDGSIDVVDGGNKKVLENDPTKNTSVQGRDIAITEAAEKALDQADAKVDEKPKRSRRKALKGTQSETEV